MLCLWYHQENYGIALSFISFSAFFFLHSTHLAWCIWSLWFKQDPISYLSTTSSLEHNFPTNLDSCFSRFSWLCPYDLVFCPTTSKELSHLKAEHKACLQIFFGCIALPFRSLSKSCVFCISVVLVQLILQTRVREHTFVASLHKGIHGAAQK